MTFSEPFDVSVFFSHSNFMNNFISFSAMMQHLSFPRISFDGNATF